MEPRWYHQNGRTHEAYRGDRHPQNAIDEYDDDVFEPQERACNNCGKVTKVFKREYLDYREFSTY